MPSPLFAVPLNMGTGTWIVTIVAGLSFVVMFGIASAFGDFQGLINTTLENDSNAYPIICRTTQYGNRYLDRDDYCWSKFCRNVRYSLSFW